MGIVRKQTAYSFVFTYIGFAIGAINTLWLFPHFFSREEFGLTRLMLDFAVFFSALSTLGSLNGLYKFNPFYRSYLGVEKNDLPFLSLMASLLGSILFIAGSLIFEGFLARKFGHNSPLFILHYRLVIPFTISYACVMMLEGFCWIIKKTIISNVVKELFFRITTSVLISLYIFKVISIDTFFRLYALSYVPAIIILAYVVFTNGGIGICARISYATKRLYKKILTFVSFHFSGMLITILPKTIDGILIAGLSSNGLANLAIYIIPNYLVTVMEVPQRSMLGIATTLIAEAWKNKDRKKIEELYHKTSLNLLIVGLGLFGIIYPNMDNLVRFLGPDYVLAKEIFLIAGIAKLVDLGMGMNAQILSLSKYWRYDFYTSAVFIVVNIILDFFLIKKYGLMGAAYGGAIALIFYNLMRCFYLWRLLKMQPFTSKTIATIAFAMIAIFAAFSLPILKHLFMDGVLRSFIFAIIFVPAIIYFNISEDITAYYKTMLNKISSKR